MVASSMRGGRLSIHKNTKTLAAIRPSTTTGREARGAVSMNGNTAGDPWVAQSLYLGIPRRDFRAAFGPTCTDAKKGRVETRPPGQAFPFGHPLRVAERNCDELGRVARLHPHQHGAL